MLPDPSGCEAPRRDSGTTGSSIVQSFAGRNLLFHRSSQALYDLDDLSAFVWRSLDEGLSPSQIIAELRKAGMAGPAASDAVTAALGQLQPFLSEATLIEADESAAERLVSLTLEIAGAIAHIHLPEPLRSEAAAVLGRMAVESSASDFQLCVRLEGEEIALLPPGQPAWRCERGSFVPALKAELLDGVLRCGRYEVALHAAALAAKEKALLIVGSPGAGKSTLSIALAHAGMKPMADDVVLVHRDGSVTGIDFPFTAKEGSWPIIAHQWPGTDTGPDYRRPDGQRVRYFDVGSTAGPQRRPIGTVVLLDRRDAGGCRIEEIDRVEALAALIAEADAPGDQLSAAGFLALTGALRDARCCRLTYADVVEGSDALRDLCA